MCCIVHRPKDSKEIPESNLKSIIKTNRDGWGVAYFKNNVINTIKSLEMDKAIEGIRALEKDNIEFLFHARYATHGDVDIKNCHPYPIHNGALFHNGKIDIVCRDKRLSDTHYFSLLVSRFLKKNRSFDWIVNQLKARIGLSRLAFITDKGQITKFGNWHEVDGCFYSKLNWKYSWDGWDDWNYYSECKPYGDYKYTRSAEKSPFESAVECCEQNKLLYQYVTKQLDENQLMMLALNYPKMCAEYLSRIHSF